MKRPHVEYKKHISKEKHKGVQKIQQSRLDRQNSIHQALQTYQQGLDQHERYRKRAEEKKRNKREGKNRIEEKLCQEAKRLIKERGEDTV